MKTVFKFMFLALAFIFHGVYADDTGFNPAFKCSDAYRNYSEPKCEARRMKALHTQCASKEVIEAPKKDGFFPVCMGTNLLGWCLCGCFTAAIGLMIWDLEKSISD